VTLTGLSFGTTSFQVRAVNSTGPSAYDSASILYADPSAIPTAPTLAPTYSAPLGVVTIEWPAVPGATSYEYYLGGGTVQTTNTNSVRLSGLVYGTSTLHICASNASGRSAYAQASIVVPPAPVSARARFTSLTVKPGEDQRVTFQGRMSGVTKAGKATIAVFIRLSNGTYRKYVYTVPTTANGSFSLRRKMPREGRAYAIVNAFGAQTKTKTFKIRD
jgi:hypothetical protein